MLLFYSFFHFSFVFNAFDTDNTGFMGFDEFMMALSVTSRGNIDDKLECKQFVKLVDFILKLVDYFCGITNQIQH